MPSLGMAAAATALVAPRQMVVSDSDEHAVVAIISIFLAVFALVAFAGRLFTRLLVMRRLGLDDYLVIAALTFVIAETIAVVIAAQNGLGRTWTDLVGSQREAVLKSLYAADMLYITAVCTAKASVAFLVKTLAPGRTQTRLTYTFCGFLIVWWIPSVIGIALACHSDSMPWDHHVMDATCLSGIKTFWNVFNILSMITDAFLIAWPTVLFQGLQTSIKNRALVIFCFSTRLLVIAATIAQEVLLNEASNSSDPSSDRWPFVLTSQIVQCLAITTACVPYLRAFLDNIGSGYLQTDRTVQRFTYTGGLASIRHPSFLASVRSDGRQNSQASASGGLHLVSSKDNASANHRHSQALTIQSAIQASEHDHEHDHSSDTNR